MLKRIVSVVLALSILFAMSSFVFAEDDELEALPERLTFTDDQKAAIVSIPIFIAEINAETEEEREAIYVELHDFVEKTLEARKEGDVAAGSAITNQFGQFTDGYRVRELNNIEKLNYFDDEAFYYAYKQALEYINAGVNVNFFIKYAHSEKGQTRVNPGLQVPTYNNGIYNGYSFLYDQVADYNVETAWVDTNFSTTFNFQHFFSGIAKAAVSTAISGVGGPILSAIYETLSAFVGSVNAPISITYSDAPSSYFRTKYIGQLLTRVYYIRDDDNHFPGYDYYVMGSAQAMYGYVGTESYYPTGMVLGNPTYDYIVKNSHAQWAFNEGYSGSSSFYQAMYNRYVSAPPVLTYDETLNVSSIVTSYIASGS